jgi:hypothetical protein
MGQTRAVRFSIILIVGLLPYLDARAEDFVALLKTGQVSVTDVHGTGSSSGLSLQGNLLNTTNRELEVNVILSTALFLKNQNKGQNMLVVGVVEQSGEYYTRGSDSFIQVSPNSVLPIGFVAYCADFDKDNPSSGHAFVVSTVPGALEDVAEAIRLGQQRNLETGVDNPVALQLALWLAQGVAPAEILERFPFTAQDEQLAQDLLQGIN